MKLKILLFALAIALIVLTPTITFASDISDAVWRGVVRITNSGSAATNESVTANISSSSLIDNGFASDDLTDVAVQYSGSDIAFMPGVSSNPWCFFVDSINGNSNKDYSLYSSGATGGKIRYFPNADGMATVDNATMELGRNATIEQKGWFDTASGANKTLVEKEDAFKSYISATGAITSEYYNYILADNYTDETADWSNEANAYDNATATNASTTSNNGATGYLRLDYWTPVLADELRYWVNDVDSIDIEISDDNASSWDNLYTGAPAGAGSWQTVEISPAYTITNIRINAEVTAMQFYLYELQPRNVTRVTATGVSSGEYTVKTIIQPQLLANASFEEDDPPASWTLSGAGASLSRSDTQKHDGGYSCLLTRNGTDCLAYQDFAGYAAYKGETVTLGGWIYATVASRAKFRISDGITTTASSFHTGVAGWEWLIVSHTVDSGATQLRAQCLVFSGDTSAYFDDIVFTDSDNTDFNLAMFIDDTLEDSIRLYDPLRVPNNSDNYSFAKNSSISYLEYQKIWINGDLQQHIAWEYDTTFHDLSGNDHDATPNFRTTNSNADVTASLISFNPISQSKVATFSLSETYEILTANATAPTNFFDDGDYSKLPAEPINEMLDTAGVPRSAWWLPFIFFGIGIIGMIAYGATTTTRGPTGRLAEGQIDGSLLLQFIVTEIAIIVLGGMGPIPFWPAYLYPIAGIALILSRKHFAWG